MRISSLLWLPFFFCFYWACICFNFSLVSGYSVHCLEEQKLLLLQLKKNLKFNPIDSRKLPFWNESSPCSEWRGVSWDEEGYVGGLDLSEESISGGLDNSSTLFSLQYLSHLNLAFNNFSSAIPSTIRDLKNLTSLNLSSAGFVDNIPMEIAQLTRLTILDLSTYYLAGSTLKLENPNLEKLVQTLSEVKELYLDGINIPLNESEWGHVLSFFLPHLEVLSMSSCNLRQFPGFLRNMSRLAYLDLSNNEIVEKIPHWIWELGYLGQLNLSHNSIREIERTSQTFISNNLSMLDLHDNCLQGTLPAFPPFASYLDYSHNKFISVIPPDIGNYLSLTIFLSLSHNALYEGIPDSICNASYLQVLDLSSNNLSGAIPHCLAQSETLGVLNLGKNNLSGNIPNTFHASCTLRTLKLCSNNLQGPIPKSLSHYTTLEVLDIGNNKINDRFPCLLRTIPTLQVMVLRRNNFHGPIGCPNMKRMIWKMLHIVDLAFNNFSGMLSGECFQTWKAMMLDKNQRSSFGFGQLNYLDEVTVTMRGQEMTFTRFFIVLLSIIDFSFNHIKGLIPQEMMNFTTLIGFNLSNNNLTGQIPSSIWKLQHLESLDLSNNAFTGEIPSQLVSLYFLLYLNLSHNHLVGKIPTGSQLDTFDATSFQGNDGLYRPPLTQSPNNGPQGLMPPPTSANNHAIDFEFIVCLELGVIFGLVIIIWPLFFWKQWRIRYWKGVDSILCSIFPQVYVDYQRREGQWITVLRWSH